MRDRPARRTVRNLSIAGAGVVLTLAVLFLSFELRALWPALLALVLVFATRNAALSLLAACGSALLLLAVHDREGLRGWADLADGGLRGTLIGPWHLGALVFTLLLGGFAAVVERSGGLLPLLRAHGEVNEKSRRRFLTSVFGVGLLCFFDGLANALMLGRVARPVADRLRVPRVFLAYLVDTTSSAVACLAFLSTWIVTQLSYIADFSPLDTPAYLQFLESIPRNFYCWFALFLAFLAVQRNWMIGPMRRALPAEDFGDAGSGLAPNGDLWRAAIPLGVLLLSIPSATFLLYLSSGSRTGSGLELIRSALSSQAVPAAFVIGSFLALLSALVCFPSGGRREGLHAAWGGSRSLLPALAILLLAWILGSLFEVLRTAEVLSGMFGKRLPLALFPAGVFLLGCVISFVSGSSWGTMGILMPIVLPTAGTMAEIQGAPPELLGQVVPAVIGAVFGGAVFGDHCSPYSDTTIVSALASGVSTPDHTITQLPYALIAAGTALGAGYLLLSLGLPVGLSLALGGGLLVGLVFLIRPARG